MTEYVLSRVKKEMEKKHSNLIPLITPQFYCNSPMRKGKLCDYFCFLDDEDCNNKDFFFQKSREKIDEISEKCAAIAIQMNVDCQHHTISKIAGYAKEKGLITIGMHMLFSSLEYMEILAQTDSNIDIIELIHKDSIREYEQMLIDTKENNKAIMIPYSTKYDKNTDYYPFSTDYDATRKKIEQIKSGELKNLYDKQVTGYDAYWYTDRGKPIEYLYQDRVQFVSAHGSLQDVNEIIQAEKENYNVGIIIDTHVHSEIKL